MLAHFRSRGFRGYAAAVLTVALATALRFLLDPLLDDHLSFSFFYMAVSVAGWMGGVWPASLAAISSILVGNYCFTEPASSFAISGPIELIGMLLFMGVSLSIGILSEVSLRALERAQAAERAKDDFMAIVAHELRNPLSVIHYANSLNRVAGDDQARGHVEVIDRQVHRLNLLIEDLLDLSRVAHGKIRLDRRHVDASSIVAAAAEKAKPLLAGRKHKLRLGIAAGPMPLFVDPIRLEQVLTNLLTNAAKYTPDGGEISVTAAPLADSAVLTVRDSGIGISEDMLPHVFDMFAQSDRASKRSDGGLGIGLALVRNLVELHGGSVTVASEGLNRGSEFVVSLPLEQVARPERVLVEA